MNKYLKLMIALPLLAATGIPGATTIPAAYRAPDHALGWVIADQGNRALEIIRKDAVKLSAPALPPPELVQASVE